MLLQEKESIKNSHGVSNVEHVGMSNVELQHSSPVADLHVELQHSGMSHGTQAGLTHEYLHKQVTLDLSVDECEKYLPHTPHAMPSDHHNDSPPAPPSLQKAGSLQKSGTSNAASMASSTASGLSEQDAMRIFLMYLGLALHSYGIATFRVEQLLSAVSKTHSIIADYVAFPTVLICSFGSLDGLDASTRLLRVGHPSQNLEKMVLLSRLAKAVGDNNISPKTAVKVVKSIVNEKARYGIFITFLASLMTSTAVGVLLNITWQGILIGTALSIIPFILGRIQAINSTRELLSSFLVGLAATLIHSYCVSVDIYTVSVCALVGLLPGLMITIAIGELAHSSWISGTARGMGVLIQLLKLGSGLVAAAMLLERLPNPDVPIPPKYEYWVRILATLCASPAWAIIFQARPMDIPIMTATALFGNLCVFAVSKFTEPTQEVQTVLAAFGIGLISNIWSRFFDVPAAVPTVVGILTLV
eukprot:CAMPEP_0184341104 /NCGR_PEP_ID=MMETSP1089-20130417/9733_1 /TAXON_ID=38269 ORGANISM="Gloeochaete wittrockiana, Strain SAG46.84" /NCGR_SAMPLE_ID=MMETSP1089 /ASSEMBLY_ACC=CAM_ASM_000445 /LENGTH=472 /DNA_ID=CAMNT_0026669231 /DNA_START=123 /DNA_END=1538 /DNA_ORIENTATION=+